MKSLVNVTSILGAIIIAVVASTIWLTFEKSPISKIPPVDPGSSPWNNKTFRDWAYFAERSEIPAGLENRGSRIDGVEYKGEFTSGWYQSREKIEFLVAGFPRLPQNELAVESRNATGVISRQKFNQTDPRDSWLPWIVSLPQDSKSFRIYAKDGEGDENGWLALTEPFAPRFRPALISQTERGLLAFVVQAVLFSTIGFASARVLKKYFSSSIPNNLIPIVAAASVTFMGLIAFWIYFLNPSFGMFYSWSICAVSVGSYFINYEGFKQSLHFNYKPVLLAGVIGLFYVALLLLFEAPRMSYAAANRFVEGLPSDNEIPRAFAERLANGQSPKALWGDWLSSDRPPLQSGWLLITWPILRSCGYDIDTTSTTGGICFQLLWVIAVWSILTHFGARPNLAMGITAAIPFSGLTLIYSVFVWPKFAAASLCIAAYLLWITPEKDNRLTRYLIGGLCAALAWLSHGGISFSFIGLIPIILIFRKDFAPLKGWLFAALAFAVVAAPWIAYQRHYDPPGNRLLKWHLAGSPAIDERGFLQTLKEGYQNVGLKGAIESRKSNFLMQFKGDWLSLMKYWEVDRKFTMIQDEITYLFRSWSFWILGLAAPFFLAVKRFRKPAKQSRPVITISLWILFSWISWLLLMFESNSATIHQGTLAVPLLAFTVLAYGVYSFSRECFLLLTLIQLYWFIRNWVMVDSKQSTWGTWQILPACLAIVSGGILIWFVLRLARHHRCDLEISG